jgi:Flp pilus assembly protein TadD
VDVSEERLEKLRQIIEDDPNDEVGQYAYGKASLDEGHLEDAIRALREATRLNRDYSAAYRDLGRALTQAGRRHEAIRTLRRGIEVAKGVGDLQTVREMEVFIKRAAQAVAKR